MKKFLLVLLLISSWGLPAFADHITGGEIYYVYISSNSGMHRYAFTLKFYMRCNSGRQFNNPCRIAIYEKGTGTRLMVVEAPHSSTEVLNRGNNNDECINNPPTVCYEVGYYYFEASVPTSASGYVVSAQVNFRIDGISNLQPGYSGIGATYSAELPGNALVGNAQINTSARFTGSDMVVVCDNNSFTYSFAAVDNDGDLLRYSFCDAFRSSGSGGGGPTASVPPPPPPYTAVPYSIPSFSGAAPLGPRVKINPNTGLITGIAPVSGIYVVTVCVEEIRNGIVIATQRKDLQINITSCSIVAANLPEAFLLCTDSYSFTFTNNQYNPLVKSYAWELLDLSGKNLMNSDKESFTYTFPDTGVYRIKLLVNKNETCSDSGSALVKVYPGMKNEFSFEGICFNKPTVFNDQSSTIYGTINSWSWDFGESTAIHDTSRDRNTSYTYTYLGPKNVSLITTTTKGCTDTVTHVVDIVDKPPLQFAFRDTLICLRDSVQLISNASGEITWSPQTGMQTVNPERPKVSPTVTTMYYADLDDNGCINRDSLRVRVTDRVNLSVMNDTTVCAGDTIALRISSDALQYSWSPALQVTNASIQQPVAITPVSTNYEVVANTGSCIARGSVTVTTVPYPTANAGADTMICYQTGAFLHADTDGTRIEWTPSASLTEPRSRNTAANPQESTLYTLFAYDMRGCPKPGTDQVLVTVLPPISASAGSDTAVMTGQPLQFQASGGIRYEWTPAVSLNDPLIANPIAIYQYPSEGIRYEVKIYNEAGCMETDVVNVKVFEKGPAVYVPNAFTPNGDGLNDVIRPVGVSIRTMSYFRIYNRWGKVVFETSSPGSGWDGRINGQLQGSDTFVWVYKAVDYLGAEVLQKGTVTLIR